MIMEKNATVYVVEVNYDKLVCETKEQAIKLFETLVDTKCKKYERYNYDERYSYVGSGIKISLKAYVVDLYNCAEEAKVAKENEDKLIKSGIMKDKRKSPRTKEVKK